LEKRTRCLHFEHYIPKKRAGMNFPENDIFI